MGWLPFVSLWRPCNGVSTANEHLYIQPLQSHLTKRCVNTEPFTNRLPGDPFQCEDVINLYLHHQSEVVLHMEDHVARELFKMEDAGAEVLSPPLNAEFTKEGLYHPLNVAERSRSFFPMTNDSLIPTSIMEIFETIPVRQFQLEIGYGNQNALPHHLRINNMGASLNAVMDLDSDSFAHTTGANAPMEIPKQVIESYRQFVHHLSTVLTLPSLELTSEENIVMGGKALRDGLEVNSKQWLNGGRSSPSLIPQRPWQLSSRTSEAWLCNSCLDTISNLLPCHGQSGLESMVGTSLTSDHSVFRGVILEGKLVHMKNGHSKQLVLTLTRLGHLQIPTTEAQLSDSFSLGRLMERNVIQWQGKTAPKTLHCPMYDSSILHINTVLSEKVQKPILVKTEDDKGSSLVFEFEPDRTKIPFVRSFLFKPPSASEKDKLMEDDAIEKHNDIYTVPGLTLRDVLLAKYNDQVHQEISVIKDEIPISGSHTTALEAVLRWNFENKSSETKAIFYEDSIHPLLSPRWSAFKVQTTSLQDGVKSRFSGRDAMKKIGLGITPRTFSHVEALQSGIKSVDLNLYFMIPPGASLMMELEVVKPTIGLARAIEVTDKGDQSGNGRLHYAPRRTIHPSDFNKCILSHDSEIDYFTGYVQVPDLLIRTPSADITYMFKALAMGFGHIMLIAAQVQRLIFATEKKSAKSQMPLGLRLISMFAGGLDHLRDRVSKIRIKKTLG